MELVESIQKYQERECLDRGEGEKWPKRVLNCKQQGHKQL